MSRKQIMSKRAGRSRLLNRNKDLSPYLREPKSLVHTFTRIWDVGAIAQGAVDGGLGRYITLASLPNYTEFTALYNQYRIVAVEAMYLFETHILLSGKAYPRLAFCVDYNDANSPLSENDILQYPTSELWQFGQVKHSFKRQYKPRAAMAAYSGAFTSYATSSEGQWFDTDSANVAYYGTKEWFNNYNTTLASGASVRLYYRVVLQFKDTR